MNRLAMATVFVTACTLGDEFGPEDFEVTEEDQQNDQAYRDALAEGKADGELTYTAVARLALTAGLSCSGDRIPIAVAVAKAESNFDPDVTNTAGNSHGTDRGLWQINSYWHPEISRACALSPSCNARGMASISRRGTKWTEWWTYNNGLHWRYMTSARYAKAVVCP
jgi:hypothetical protein